MSNGKVLIPQTAILRKQKQSRTNTPIDGEGAPERRAHQTDQNELPGNQKRRSEMGGQHISMRTHQKQGERLKGTRETRKSISETGLRSKRRQQTTPSEPRQQQDDLRNKRNLRRDERDSRVSTEHRGWTDQVSTQTLSSPKTQR